jgi:hypothetical protein
MPTTPVIRPNVISQVGESFIVSDKGTSHAVQVSAYDKLVPTLGNSYDYVGTDPRTLFGALFNMLKPADPKTETP